MFSSCQIFYGEESKGGGGVTTKHYTLFPFVTLKQMFVQVKKPKPKLLPENGLFCNVKAQRF